MMRYPVSTALLLSVLLAASTAHADRRVFGHVYPYATLPEGSLELEHYLDAGFAEWQNPADPEEQSWSEVNWRHQVEFEYGISDHLDVGFYNVFRQAPYGSLSYEGLKLRSRFRIGEANELPVDLGVYGEVAYYGESVKFEERLIIAKRVGAFELSFNAKAEQKLELETSEMEYEFYPLLGVGYHLTTTVALGIEYYGKLKVAEGEAETYVNYLGPTVSVAGNNFYWTLAVQPQLGSEDGQPVVQLRSLFGIML